MPNRVQPDGGKKELEWLIEENRDTQMTSKGRAVKLKGQLRPSTKTLSTNFPKILNTIKFKK